MLTLIYSIIEFIVVSIILLFKLLIRALSSSSDTSPSDKPQSSTVKEKKVDLSDSRRYDIVKAILDDSLLVLDSAYDALYNTGEALFSAPEALHCTYPEYKEQYGSRKWKNAWEKALADRFDCQCEMADKGNYYLYGKEM